MPASQKQLQKHSERKDQPTSWTKPWTWWTPSLASPSSLFQPISSHGGTLLFFFFMRRSSLCTPTTNCNNGTLKQAVQGDWNQGKEFSNPSNGRNIFFQLKGRCWEGGGAYWAPTWHPGRWHQVFSRRGHLECRRFTRCSSGISESDSSQRMSHEPLGIPDLISIFLKDIENTATILREGGEVWDLERGGFFIWKYCEAVPSKKRTLWSQPKNWYSLIEK